ncbi:MAG TPA: EamA family transporter [Deltaproteobacteria bacterium]|nr:EamA family transporter [Deltaproteobacteria bacterium]
MYYAAIALTVASNVLYHVFQKITPAAANPLLALSVTYATSTLFCLVLFLVVPDHRTLPESLKIISWSSAALGLAIVGLELGFLLAYRSGWNISLAALASTVAVALVLLPVGVSCFRERLTWADSAGFCLCIAGLFLMNRG